MSCSFVAQSKRFQKGILLDAIGCGVEIECRDVRAWNLLIANYGHMGQRRSAAPRPKLRYVVDSGVRPAGFSICRRGCGPLAAADDSEFLFLFEKDLTIELQKLRRDLYFLHAAALEFAGKALLLAAASGQGKSTTTLGLLHHGYRYLSDELGPVDLARMEVYPYPHALCLKQEPPGGHPIPAPVLRTSRTFHIPARHLPSPVVLKPTPLTTIFLLEYCPAAKSSALEAISTGEAAARLFTHALNPLAHADDGLEGVLEIARKIRCFRLRSADLHSTCRLIREFAALHAQPEPGPAFAPTPRPKNPV
jgi:hypothetical protein